MQDQAKKKKKRQKMVYKPYKKGPAFSSQTVKQALKLFPYFILFAVLYLLLGAALSFESDALRWTANILLVLVCVAITFVKGARMGENEAALGEIAYAREQSGKRVDPTDAQRCFHPAKGFVIYLLSALPVLLITVPFALMAKKQVYALQPLPSWVSAYFSQSAIREPLRYYDSAVNYTPGVVDYLRIVVRLLVLPFANIATTDNAGAMHLVDKLSPLLSCLPAIGFPFGYLTGPRSRAVLHGDIAVGLRRARKKQQKAIQARREQPDRNDQII